MIDFTKVHSSTLIWELNVLDNNGQYETTHSFPNGTSSFITEYLLFHYLPFEHFYVCKLDKHFLPSLWNFEAFLGTFFKTASKTKRMLKIENVKESRIFRIHSKKLIIFSLRGRFRQNSGDCFFFFLFFFCSQ